MFVNYPYRSRYFASQEFRMILKIYSIIYCNFQILYIIFNIQYFIINVNFNLIGTLIFALWRIIRAWDFWGLIVILFALVHSCTFCNSSFTVSSNVCVLDSLSPSSSPPIKIFGYANA